MLHCTNVNYLCTSYDASQPQSCLLPRPLISGIDTVPALTGIGVRLTNLISRRPLTCFSRSTQRHDDDESSIWNRGESGCVRDRVRAEGESPP